MKVVDKFLKILWLINGLLILVLVGYLLTELISKEKQKRDRVDNEAMVGVPLEEAKNRGVALQGLKYDAPEQIGNTDISLLLISSMTYEQEKELKGIASMAGDISYSAFNCINVVFLDTNYNVIRKLLDKKASISDLKVPGRYGRRDESDTLYKNIAYKIGFEDNNKDNLLSEKDNQDLFISDLDGSNLKRITEELDIISFNFTNHYRELFITYHERTNEIEEHKRKKFARYYIEKEMLQLLSELDREMNEIEKILIK